MRDLVIQRLTTLIEDSCDEGISRYFECESSEMITDPKELQSMSDEELLEALETAVGFQG
jgi:uncharacterized protein YkuJ